MLNNGALIGRDLRVSVLVFVLLMCSGFAFGQSFQLKSGATIYIEPMDGYGTYLAAALIKENVPVAIVTQKEYADYIVSGGAVHNEPSAPAVVINNTASASINEGGNVRAGNAATASAFQQGSESAERRRAAKAALGSSDSTISIEDTKSTQIVFAYSAGKGGGNQFQKTAEACAKHLKEFIKKSEK